MASGSVNSVEVETLKRIKDAGTAGGLGNMNEDEIVNIVNVIIDKINISPNIPITIIYEQDEDEEQPEEDDAFIVEC